MARGQLEGSLRKRKFKELSRQLVGCGKELHQTCGVSMSICLVHNVDGKWNTEIYSSEDMGPAVDLLVLLNTLPAAVSVHRAKRVKQQLLSTRAALQAEGFAGLDVGTCPKLKLALCHCEARGYQRL